MTQSSRFVSLCKNIQKHLESDRPVAVDMITHKLIKYPKRRTAGRQKIAMAKVTPRVNRHTTPAGSAEAADAGGDGGVDSDPDPERPRTTSVVKGGV